MSVVAFARLVREELEESLQTVEGAILNGVVEPHVYQSLVGERRGIRKAIDAVNEVTRKFDVE